MLKPILRGFLLLGNLFAALVLETLRSVLVLSMLICSVPQLVFVLPQGQNVIHGQAEFEQQGQQLQIRASDNAIIQYQQFNVEQSESVQFIQPSESSRVLNHVTGGAASHILGNIYGNGQVYLLNSSGIFIGDQAVIDLASFYAVAGKMDYSDFLQNIDQFTNLQGAVINYGALTAKKIALLGRTVGNYGDIYVENGLVTLAAGENILIGEEDGHFYIYVETPEQAQEGEFVEETGVAQHGNIQAGEEGQVILGTRDLFYALSVDHTGSTQAGDIDIDVENGVALIEGELNADRINGDQKGGSVTIEADFIETLPGTVISANGNAGGGEILIGGNYQGKGPQRNATGNYTAERVKITANALKKGNGGRVILWANDTTIFYGDIEAKGGSEGGDGGFVEVSGKEYLEYEGTTDATAPKGEKGDLLLDPNTITIDESFNDRYQKQTFNANTGNNYTHEGYARYAFDEDDKLNDNNVGRSETRSWQEKDRYSYLCGSYNNSTCYSVRWLSRTDSHFQFTLAKLESELASANVTLYANQDINLNAPIADVANSYSLTMDANRHIYINQSISMNGYLTLRASNNLNFNASVYAANGISATGGDVLFSGSPTISSANDIVITNNSSASSSGNPTFTTPTDLTINGSSLQVGRFIADVGQDIDINVDMTATGNGNSLEADRDIFLKGFNATGGTLSIVADANQDLDGDITLESGTVNASTNLSLQGELVNINNTAVTAGTQITIQPQNPSDIGLGDYVSSDFDYDQATLDKIVAPTVIIGGDQATSITVENVNMSTNVNLFKLQALSGDDANVSFINQDSSFFKNLTVNANNAILVDQNLTNAGTLRFDSDVDNNGTGDITISADKTVTTTDGNLYFVGNDLHLDGYLNTGTADIRIEASDEGTLAMGDSTANFTIAGTELINMTGNNLVIGGVDTHDITVDNTTLTNSYANLTGSLTIYAQSAESSIHFANNDSETRALNLYANKDVILSQNVTSTGYTEVDADLDNTGIGDFTIDVGKTLSTTDNDFNLTANDIHLPGTINTGIANINMTNSDGEISKLGNSAPSDGFNLDRDEFTRIFANDFTFQSNPSGGNIEIDGITFIDLIGIVGEKFIYATNNEATVTFLGDDIEMADATIHAHGDITTDANVTTTGVFNIDADRNNSGAGDFSVTAGHEINTQNEDMTVVANDVDYQGTINVGTASITQTTSDGGGIGLGITAHDMTVSGAELQNVTAAHYTLGDDTSADIVLDSITAANSANVEKVTLYTPDTEQTQLKGGGAGSHFRSLEVDSGARIDISDEIITYEGNLDITQRNGNANATGTNLANATLTSEVDLTVKSQHTLSSTGMHYRAKNDVTIDGGVYNITSGDVTIDADTDSTGAGDFFYNELAEISRDRIEAASGDVNITADDVHIAGMIRDANSVNLMPRTSSTLGLGNHVSGDFDVDNTEFSNIVSGTMLTIGNELITAADLDGVRYMQGEMFEAGMGPNHLTVQAQSDNAQITIVGNNNSIDGTLYLTADENIDIDGNLHSGLDSIFTADDDNDGEGNYTVQNTSALTADNFTIEANDVIISADSSMNANNATGDVEFIVSDSEDVSLGDTVKPFQMTGAELETVTAKNFYLTSLRDGNFFVDNISFDNNSKINTLVELKTYSE
ncbi:MAG: filamentous hemagglutinin N-terminal domain-containing protein, partial [Chlamydiales bacterium]|nr:filamentous hemagglutinin N-terminal domain-containing protein [Chlamydiales bacterium]